GHLPHGGAATVSPRAPRRGRGPDAGGAGIAARGVPERGAVAGDGGGTGQPARPAEGRVPVLRTGLLLVGDGARPARDGARLPRNADALRRSVRPAPGLGPGRGAERSGIRIPP